MAEETPSEKKVAEPVVLEKRPVEKKTGGTPANGDPYRILAIDDSSTQRKILQTVFNTDNYEIDVAEGGNEGVKLLGEKDYDVLLLDIELEGATGFDVCRHIRDKMCQPILPILFISSHVSAGVIQKALSVGGDEFIVKPFDAINIRERVECAARQKRMLQRLDPKELVLFSVAYMVEAQDKESGDHCDRLSHMCAVFANKLGLSDDEKITLEYASILHDIGKLAMPEEILTKQTPLSEEEWRMMQRHTIIGASMCGNIRSGGPIADIIRHHHEKYDGSGYPDGLKDEEISKLTRIFQIVDMYDSMTHSRTYNEPFPRDRVVTIMAKEAQKGLRDAELTQVFLEIACKEPQLLVRNTVAAQAMSNYKINAILDSTMLVGKGKMGANEEDIRR